MRMRTISEEHGLTKKSRGGNIVSEDVLVGFCFCPKQNGVVLNTEKTRHILLVDFDALAPFDAVARRRSSALLAGESPELSLLSMCREASKEKTLSLSSMGGGAMAATVACDEEVRGKV